MTKLKLVWQSAISAVGVLAYIMLVAWIMNNGERLFGEMDNYIGPVVFLMLFVFSATVTGLLVLGRPVYLLLSGQKNEAVKLFFYTLLWMLIFVLTVFNIAVFV
jgi:hypothetical protein